MRILGAEMDQGAGTALIKCVLFKYNQERAESDLCSWTRCDRSTLYGGSSTKRKN